MDYDVFAVKVSILFTLLTRYWWIYSIWHKHGLIVSIYRTVWDVLWILLRRNLNVWLHRSIDPCNSIGGGSA